MNSVVITGVGMRTPIGNSIDDAREAFLSGRSAIRRVDGPNGHVRAMATLTEDLGKQFSRGELLTLDPAAQYAIVASNAALADSGIDLASADRDRIGVYVGCGQGATETRQTLFIDVHTKDSAKKFSILRGLDNGTANHVSIRHKLRGECMTIALACSSSNSAIGTAVRAIRHGYMDAALAGGAEATFTEGAVRGWEAMGVLARFDPERAHECCRPFSKNRTGLVLGEGAVMYMLESESHARARGARIYARVSGYGTSSDATSLATPDASGQVLAMQRCFADAGLSPLDVKYVNAHGTATPTGDPSEVGALRQIYGERVADVPVSATKSIHGHLLGAAGAVELLAAIIAVRDGILAPTVNLDEVDPELAGLDYVPNVARQNVDVPAAMSNSFAFGGSNACLLLTRV